MDSSKEGIIFFSLVSNIQPSDMTKDKFLAFVTVFTKLNQTVLWKWDQGTMPGRPRNVHIGKWFPQNDILGHQNVKLFITHGGLLSLQEAVYHAIPVLEVPVFSDQRVNVIQAESKGYAVQLLFSNVTEEFLLKAINEVLNNPRVCLHSSVDSITIIQGPGYCVFVCIIIFIIAVVEMVSIKKTFTRLPTLMRTSWPIKAIQLNISYHFLYGPLKQELQENIKNIGELVADLRFVYHRM